AGRAAAGLVEDAVRLREALGRVVAVALALVAGQELAGRDAAADADAARPPLRAAVEREPGRVEAVAREVVPVLVRGDLLRRHACRRVADDDELVGAVAA